MCKFLLPKIFLLGEKSPTPKIWDNPHGHQYWWPSTPSPPNSPRQAVQLPLQQKNHQVPNLHTVAANLRTVVHPPVALQAIYYNPRGQSTVRFDYVLGLSRTHINKKKPSKVSTFFAHFKKFYTQLFNRRYRSEKFTQANAS
jgi:hypothetical protein